MNILPARSRVAANMGRNDRFFIGVKNIELVKNVFIALVAGFRTGGNTAVDFLALVE
jgi:hypothetical protein